MTEEDWEKWKQRGEGAENQPKTHD
jgi:hypothetical protein